MKRPGIMESRWPSGDWSLRITKLEGTAYDWSHCLVAPVQIAANQQLPSGDRSRLRPVIDFWLPTSQLIGSYSLKILHYPDSSPAHLI